MATMTRSEMIDKVLQDIGVLAAGQSANAEDADKVGKAADGAWAELRTLGLAPFATSAIPEWAQSGFGDYVAADVKPSFGIPMSNQAKEAEQTAAERKLRRQLAGYRQLSSIPAKYY